MVCFIEKHGLGFKLDSPRRSAPDTSVLSRKHFRCPIFYVPHCPSLGFVYSLAADQTNLHLPPTAYEAQRPDYDLLDENTVQIPTWYPEPIVDEHDNPPSD